MTSPALARLAAVALGAALALAARAEPFRGVEGAGPAADSGRPGCWVYDRWVVTAATELARERTSIRVARIGPGAPADVAARCALPPEVERSYGLGDEFAGLAGDVLLVRLQSAPDGGLLVLERLGGKGEKVQVSYGDGEPSAVDGVVRFREHLAGGTTRCPSELWIPKVSRAACEKKARAWWTCRRKLAGPRLAASPDPFDADAFTRDEYGDGCQVRLYEEVQVRLADLSVTPTGRARAVVHFAATE